MRSWIVLSVVLLAACDDSPGKVRLASLPLDLSVLDYPTLLIQRPKYGPPDIGYPLSHYGYVIPATSEAPAEKNLQPTFWAPLGTTVLAPISGTVKKVPELYSGDFSVHFEGSDGAVWETEHVRDVIVSVGDTVD